MSSAEVVIRPLDDDDWDRVFEIFTTVVAEGETYAYPDALSSEAAHALWVEGPPGQAVVALRDGVILGTAKFGPNRPARGSHVATASFMVASDARGSGVGRAMCAYVIAAAKEQGYAAMQFNAVVSTNVHAIELYRQLGFVTIGTVPEAFEHATRGRVGLDIMYLQF
ncbi:MAG TPA: GNAT family N-acetyltransferase [Acidimicrobiales bacterium]